MRSSVLMIDLNNAESTSADFQLSPAEQKALHSQSKND